MKKLYIAFIAIFLAVIILPGVYILAVPDKDFSDNENRVLQTAPELNGDTILDGSFQSKLSKYLSDQFPARDLWTAVGTKIKLSVGFSDIGGAYIGKDGYYMEKITDADFSLDRYRENLASIKSFIDASGLPSTVVLVPAAGTVLSDKLPANAQMYDPSLMYSVASDCLGDSARLPDLYSALRDHADEYIFYRTDHHWTTMGALIAYNCIMQDNGAYTGELQKVSDSFLGTTYSKTLDSAAKPDEVYIAPISDSLAVTADGKDIEVYDMSALEKKDKYTVFFGGNRAMMLISGGAQNGKTLLVIKDSFANSLAPFLTADYENILMLDLRYYNGSVKSLLASAGVTDIMFVGEMSNIAKDENLFKLLF